MRRLAFILCLVTAAAFADRPPPRVTKGKVFKHPGITYTQGDFDRMKAMVAAGREPWKRCFEGLKSSRWASPGVFARGRGAGLGSFNNTIGFDGRQAHDQALMYRLTGDEGYAVRARDLVNSSVNYRDVWATGTPALDNGKIFLLVEAAEMIRDFRDWAEADREKFRKVLREVFYPVICNGDIARWGNQGLSAFKGALAIAIFLDDEKMYDRVWNYLTGRAHRPDDAPYPSGGAWCPGWPADFSPWLVSRRNRPAHGNEPDWGYDELLQYYIYRNGQCEESCRDQAHCMYGLMNYVGIAEMFWNQGDDLYGELDNRILKGLEWSLRYNMSDWEPKGYSEKEEDVSFENEIFYKANTRSGRWTALAQSPHGRGSDGGPAAPRTCALMHYSVVKGLPDEATAWTKKAVDRALENNGFETWGFGANWYYEFTGWGTLTKTRTKWMRGDPGTWKDGVHRSGAHALPGTVKFTDWDYFPGETPRRTARRKSKDRWSTGDWTMYTVTCDAERKMELEFAYSALEPAEVTVATESGKPLSVNLPPVKGKPTVMKLGAISVPAGASVVRFAIRKCGAGFNPVAFRFK